ncbi:MAG: hypothetical protein FWE95_03990 [Planctomycetaceae bacterium]|nr:hypothetical protein [Planctomycetaceae bacterium]
MTKRSVRFPFVLASLTLAVLLAFLPTASGQIWLQRVWDTPTTSYNGTIENAYDLDWVRVYSYAERKVVGATLDVDLGLNFGFDFTFNSESNINLAGTVKEGEERWSTGFLPLDKFLEWQAPVGITKNIADTNFGTVASLKLQSFGAIEKTPDTMEIRGTAVGTGQGGGTGQGQALGTATGRVEINDVFDAILINPTGINIGTALVAGYGNFNGNYRYGVLQNSGNIGSAFVDAYGDLRNQRGDIELAIVNDGGYLGNSQNAHIGMAIVGQWGYLQNNLASTIEAASIDTGGTLVNTGANSLIETAYLTGGTVSNQNAATIETAYLTGGTINNQNTATIDTAYITGGTISNQNAATIKEATVTQGILHNGGTSNITTASVNDGTLYNGYNGGGMGTITTANVNGGTLYNSYDAYDNNDIITSYNSTITTANVDGGILYNGYGSYHRSFPDFLGFNYTVRSLGTITTANVNGSTLYNGYNGGSGTITTANVDGGELYNGYGSLPNGYSYISSMGTITTANVNGGTLYNSSGGGAGTITTANVDGGGLYNGYYGTGTITTANVNDGILCNGYGRYSHYGYFVNSVGRITTANVNGGTLLNGFNSSEGRITTANVYNGYLYNAFQGGASTFTTANVYGGTLYNGYNGGRGTITTANVDGGELSNGYANGTGTITSANVNGGTLYNGDFGTGTITTANVDGGDLYNRSMGNIANLAMNGGNVTNSGRIDNLTYYAGNYSWVGDASIGTLILAGDSDGIDWGNVGKIAFHENGQGVIRVRVEYAAAPVGFGIQAMQALKAAPSLVMIPSIQADEIDFTYANIIFELAPGVLLEDFADLVYEGGVSLENIFGAGVTLPETAGLVSLAVLVGGEPMGDWGIDLATSQVVIDGDECDLFGCQWVAVVTNATCTAGGYTTYTCSVCGDWYVDDRTGVLAHNYEWVYTEPTCTADGYWTGVCVDCGEVDYEVDSGSALGHDWSEPYWNGAEWVAVCEDCGETKTVPVTGGCEEYGCQRFDNPVKAEKVGFAKEQCLDCGEWHEYPLAFEDTEVSNVRVEQLNGNQNRLWITVLEVYEGFEFSTTQSFMIANNSAGTYTVSKSKVYVDTKGNTQIRAAHIVP